MGDRQRNLRNHLRMQNATVGGGGWGGGGIGGLSHAGEDSSSVIISSLISIWWRETTRGNKWLCDRFISTIRDGSLIPHRPLSTPPLRSRPLSGRRITFYRCSFTFFCFVPAYFHIYCAIVVNRGLFWFGMSCVFWLAPRPPHFWLTEWGENNRPRLLLFFSSCSSVSFLPFDAGHYHFVLVHGRIGIQGFIPPKFNRRGFRSRGIELRRGIIRCDKNPGQVQATPTEYSR